MWPAPQLRSITIRNLENFMPLTDFEIIHARTGDDDPENCCRDGSLRVLAMVTDEAWDDALRLPSGETLKTVQEKNVLSQAHLEVLQELIQARYSAGAYELLHRSGSTLPLVKFRSEDLERVRSRLSREPLDELRHSQSEAQ
jgi:hypothetical protein